MKKNKHIGSDFDDFLKEEGIFEEIKVTALKRIIAYLLQKEMLDKGISHAAMAKTFANDFVMFIPLKKWLAGRSSIERRLASPMRFELMFSP